MRAPTHLNLITYDAPMTTALPKWVSELRDHRALAQFSWLSADRGNAVRSEWLDIWSQVAFEDAFHARCRKRLERCIPFATGPSRERRLSQTPSRLTLVFDPELPDMVLTSLSHAIPSACWSVALPEDLSGVLAAYVTNDAPARDARTVRVVKPIDVANPQVIADAIDSLELWVDDAFWGSSWAEDPWPIVTGNLNMVSLSVHVQRFSEHDPDRFPTVGCRTLWSKSTMRIEQHPRSLFMFELRFRSAPDARAIQHLNEQTGAHLPLDLPVDLAASLLRGRATLNEVHVEELEQRGEPSFEALALRCALAPSSPPTIERLRAAISENKGNDKMLAAIASLASAYRHDGLLFEIADGADASLRKELESFLRPQPVDAISP